MKMGSVFLFVEGRVAEAADATESVEVRESSGGRDEGEARWDRYGRRGNDNEEESIEMEGGVEELEKRSNHIVPSYQYQGGVGRY